MRVKVKRIDSDFNFEATNEDGNTVLIDGAPAIGGHNKGMRPMQLLLAAIGGCSAIDIVSILRKQKQVVDSFEIELYWNRKMVGIECYSLFKTNEVNFILKGNIDKEKAERAVKLSMEKYCSVTKTLEPTAKISYKVTLN